MTFSVELTAQADNDLRSIYEYISYDLQSPENAERQLDCLQDMILSLENMPERFRRYERAPWRSRGLRIVPVDNYVILYIPDLKTQIVTVIRIAYRGRNIDKLLDIYTKQ